MRDIKLLALDIDGTILTQEKQLTERTRNAVEAAIAADISVVLVTGRPLYGIPDELLSISGLNYVITSNGAVTTALTERRVLRTANLDADTAFQVIDMLRARNLVHTVFADGLGYCEPGSFLRHMELIHGTPIEPYIRKSRRITRDMRGQIRKAKGGIENIWFLTRNREERDALSKQIENRCKVQTVLTGEIDVEVGNREADKGRALSELADLLGVDRQRIMAIGDNGNDIGMLRSAGIGVAMGNAGDAVKQEADFITLSNEEDGAALVIERVLKGGNS